MFACSGEEPQKPKVYPKVSLDIVGAESLVVIDGNANGRVSASQTNFLKLKEDGSFLAVEFRDPSGNIVDTAAFHDVYVNVTTIQNLSPEYVLLTGYFSFPDTSGLSTDYRNILVRKTDGAIYDLAVNYIPESYYKRGEDRFKKDGSDNIYFVEASRIVKVALDNPEQLTKMDLLPDGQYANYFEISSDGVCMYEYYQSSLDFRIRKPDGGIFVIDVEGQTNDDFWTGVNGSLYFLTWGPGGSVIHQIVLVDGEVTIKDVWSGEYINMDRSYSSGSMMIKMGNSVLFINPDNPQGSWEFSETENVVKKIELPFAEPKSKLVHSDDYYYIATNDDLFKIDKSNHTYTSLLGAGRYEVYAMSVDDNEKVRFSGLRFKDGRKIFAEIDADGMLTTIDEELNQAAIILKRIN